MAQICGNNFIDTQYKSQYVLCYYGTESRLKKIKRVWLSSSSEIIKKREKEEKENIERVKRTNVEQETIKMEIEKGMAEKLSKPYHLTAENCAQAVKYALEKGGVATVPPPLKMTKFGEIMMQGDRAYQYSKHVNNNIVPSSMFQNIKSANKNGKSYKVNTK